MSRGYLQIVQLHEDCKNGKVFIYLAGGTTLAEIYDPVSGDEITNPVDIDSRGYTQAFTVDDSTLYDIKAVDFLGAPKLTRQNVTIVGGGTSVPGPQGIQGVKGDKGDKGDTGSAGQDGVDGTNGVDGTDGTDGVSLVSIRVDESSNTGKVLYNLSNDPSTFIDAGDIIPAGIGQIKIDANDSLGYLGAKLDAGEGITIGQPVSTSTLTITNSAPETYTTQASQYSTVKDFLNTIIEGTSGITVSVSADFNKIILSGAGIGGSGFTPKGEWVSGTTYVEGDGVWYYDDSVSPVINRYYVATTTTATNPYTDGTGWVIMFSIDQLGDQMVKLDNDDSTTGFLLSKLVAGDGITFTRTVDAGGDFITIDGQPTFTISIDGYSSTIGDLSNQIYFESTPLIIPQWDGTKIQFDHNDSVSSGTVVTQTATGLPKFDTYGHYKGESDAIEISDVSGLETALTTAGDSQVKVVASDTKGYLADKIDASGAVTVATIGGGGGHFKTLVRGSGKVAIDDVDDIAYESHGYLADKIVAGDNISIDVIDSGTNKTLEINAVFANLDDDYPIIAEYGNTSLVTFATNNSGSAVLKIAGKSTDVSLPVARIDNYSKFSTTTGVFAPEKDGYYVMSFKGWLQPTSSTSLNVDVSLGVKVETSYDGVTWASMGSDASKWFYMHATSSWSGYGKPIAFDMVVDMKDNQFSGAHKQARIVLQHNAFGSGYNNSLAIVYPQIYFYELKRPIGIQGPAGTVSSLDSIPDVDIDSAQTGQVLTYDAVSGNWENQYTTISGAGDIGINDLQLNDVITWNGSNWQNAPQSGGGSDGKVKVTASDPTAEYLYDKLTAGAGMSISTDDDTVTLTVNPPQDSLQTFPIAMADSAGGSFDSAFGHITAVYVPYNTTMDRMACYVTQTGGASLYLAVYDSSYNLLCQTVAFTPSSYGVTVANLQSTCSLSKNQRYYFGVVGSSNGVQLLKFASAYVSNEPFLAKFDANISTPPATFGGSSSADRFWIIGYKS